MGSRKGMGRRKNRSETKNKQALALASLGWL